MKQVILTNGNFATIDDQDYEMIAKLNWTQQTTLQGRIYAISNNIYMHRLIMNAKPKEWIHHKDGNGLNNTRSNLAICTPSQNIQNSHKHRDSKSNFKGVVKRKNCDRYEVAIFVNGKRQYLGLFEQEINAARAYDAAARKYYGDFARCNFPDPQPQEAAVA